MWQRFQLRRVVLIAIAALAALLIVAVILELPGIIAAGPLPVLALLVGVCVIVRMARRRFSASPPERGSYWSTLEDLEDAGFFGTYGWPLGTIEGHTFRLPKELERQSVIVAAAPGSGKSSGITIPAILSESERPENDRRVLVILDPKDELTTATLPTLALRSHRCLVFDPSNPDACTVGLDFLAGLPAPTDERFIGEVKTVARAWYEATQGSGEHRGDKFWTDQGRSFTEALFVAFAVTHPGGSFLDLMDWSTAFDVQSFQEFLSSSAHPPIRATAQQIRSIGLSEKTIGPIFGEVLQKFDLLIDPVLRRGMSVRPAIDWRALLLDEGEKPPALYLKIGAQDADRLAPLLSMAMSALYRSVGKVAGLSPTNQLPKALCVIADEWANLPPILGMRTALNTLRSYNVGHLLFCQSHAQIAHQYGRDEGLAIENAIVTKVVLPGAALADAQMMQSRAGDITVSIPTESVSRNGLFHRTHTQAYADDRRPLVAASDIVHMSGHLVVSTRGVMPICLELQMYFNDAELVDRLAEDKREYERLQAAKRPVVTLPPPPAAVVEQPPEDSSSPVSVRVEGAHDYSDGMPKRDVPPPGCSVEEWDHAASSLHIARWSMDSDLQRLSTGRVPDLDALHAEWQTSDSLCTPERFLQITPEEAAAAPAFYSYLRGLAQKLEICEGDDEVSPA